jgi:L-threonylcarbamoyladenylate synthase
MRQKEIVKILKNGKVGVMATDTIYGLVGSALSKKAVSRIYKLRKRNLKKPMIVLIGSLGDLEIFGIKTSQRLKNFLSKIWPGPISIILPCAFKKFSYLHGGVKSLAFRLPAKKELIKLLRQTGPLVAPSANISGLPASISIKEAKKIFGDKVDFYLDSGTIKGSPSTLIEIKRL